MIPEFPDFKKLELSDKQDIEGFTRKFPPYSDFNFANIWAWDTQHKMRVSQLNGNLAVLFNCYVSGKHFYSFIGENKISETASELIAFSKKSLSENEIRLIPEEIANALPPEFTVAPDRDSHDYIYSVAHLANMNNWANTTGRGIRQFVKSHPGHIVKQSSIKEIPKDEYARVFKRWATNKKIEDHFELNEYKAFERFMQVDDKNIEVISMYVNDTLAGFTSYEILPNHHAISHFIKADTGCHRGINDALSWEEAKQLAARGIKHCNWEQDLGIPGLRSSKERYSPSHFMKKFVVGHKS